MKIFIFVWGLLAVCLGPVMAALPSIPEDEATTGQQHLEREYARRRGFQDRGSEWNLEGARTIGISAGFFSQSSLVGGQSASPAPIYEVYWPGGNNYRFIHRFSMQGWPLQMVLPEIYYRHYFTHGVAGGVSLGYGSQTVETVSFNVAEEYNGADRAYSRGRLHAQDKMTQIPLFFYLQMDTKPSVSLKPYFRIGLGLVNASVSRTMVFTTFTDFDTGSDGTINSSAEETSTLFSGSMSQAAFAGRGSFGMEWTLANSRIVWMNFGYQGALASPGGLGGKRLESTQFSRDLGPRNFSGLIFSLGIDFLW